MVPDSEIDIQPLIAKLGKTKNLYYQNVCDYIFI